MSLDLSLVTDADKLAVVNAFANAAANTFKLSLADVLSTATSEAVQSLNLSGDINDTAVFSFSEWVKAGSISQNSQNLSLYNAANDAFSQLLIDTHVLTSQNGH
jgi:hypothetical protein